MSKRWVEVKKYTRIYYKLGTVFENIEEHKLTEEAVGEMVEILKEEGINNNDEMLKFIMQTFKGQANLEIVSSMLYKIGAK